MPKCPACGKEHFFAYSGRYANTPTDEIIKSMVPDITAKNIELFEKHDSLPIKGTKSELVQKFYELEHREITRNQWNRKLLNMFKKRLTNARKQRR